MEQWLSDGLSKLLDFEVPEDLITYVLAISNEADMIEYMRTLLDFDNPRHKTFFEEIIRRKFPTKGNSVPMPKQQKKKISKNNANPQHIVSVEAQPTQPEPDTDKGKKKTKFVNLYSKEGEKAQVVLLKGRHHCDCEASRHDLVNNCLHCGRVVCKQEGSGPCLFCGNLVCTTEEENEINSNTQGGSKLMAALLERSRPKGWEAALAHRDMLLEYDRNSEQRTRVIDDDTDYFNTNSVWLSDSERERLEKYQQQLQEKKHASRLQKKMTFDFAGRQVIEDSTIEHEVDLDKISEITSGGGDMSGSGSAKYLNNSVSSAARGDRPFAPGVNALEIKFTPTAASEGETYAMATKTAGLPPSRVQDAEQQKICDTGRCMSMHQPWASLLVEGIKLHEGRTWYSSHRGRLWIASTAKPPDQELVRDIEEQYRAQYPDKNLKFPSFYPTGCLLGCVTVDECLPQEEYRELYPDGESDSPYVFVCSRPISLRLRFPIQGQHKIYALEKTIHMAALKSIQTTARLQASEAKEA